MQPEPLQGERAARQRDFKRFSYEGSNLGRVIQSHK